MWVIETLDKIVDEELCALPVDMRVRFQRICDLITAVGMERVGEPHIKHLEGKLWEMRMAGRDGIARAIYITAKERRVVIVRAFVKKTRKTPRGELKLAAERAGRVT